jgi:hypothetical protein
MEMETGTSMTDTMLYYYTILLSIDADGTLRSKILPSIESLERVITV